MLPMRPKRATIEHAVAGILASSLNARSVPVPAWSAVNETPHEFAARIAPLAHSGRQVLAVVPHGFVVPSWTRAVELPRKLHSLVNPYARSRYRCASGGRGSAKSHTFATAIVLLAMTRRIRVLCAREIMRSLRESVHHLLEEKIDALRLTRFFDITDATITCTATGSEVIFAGLWANISSLKSLENISLVWIEEAESVSARSLEVLVPTIRASGSEIWLSLNPDAPDAPAMQFTDGSRHDVRHEHVVFSDNPWFPEELEQERLYLQRIDDGLYQHVWLGECRTISDAQIFRNKFIVDDFTPAADWDGPYHGLDLGFSADPSVLTKCWVHDNRLFVEREAWGLHVDIDKLPRLLDQVAGARNHTIRVDSSRPETISYLRQHGYPLVNSVEKWPDSVSDGIARMRAFEQIVLYPSCEQTAQEFRLYSYKVDRLTGDVLPIVIDRYNHCIDSIRYGIAPLIGHAGPEGLIEFYRQQAEKDKATIALARRPGVVTTDLFGHQQ